MLPIVGNDPSKPQSKLGVLVTRIWSVPWGQGDMGVLPGAPFSGRQITNNRIRVGKHPSIGIDQLEVPKSIRYGIAETVPLLGEHASNVFCDPLHLAMRGGCYEREHQRADPVGMRLGVG